MQTQFQLINLKNISTQSYSLRKQAIPAFGTTEVKGPTDYLEYESVSTTLPFIGSTHVSNHFDHAEKLAKYHKKPIRLSLGRDSQTYFLYPDSINHLALKLYSAAGRGNENLLQQGIVYDPKTLFYALE